MNKNIVAKELIKIARSLVGADCKVCEICKKTENLIFNNHPKAQYHCLCENCIDQHLKKNSPDRITFDRLMKQKHEQHTASELIKIAKSLIGSNPVVEKILSLKNGQALEFYNTPPDGSSRSKLKIEVKIGSGGARGYRYSENGKSFDNGKFRMITVDDLEDAAKHGKWDLHK